MTEPDELTRFLAGLAAGISDGEVTAADVLAAPLAFSALAVMPPARLRLIDEVERAFDDFPEHAADPRPLAVCLQRHGVQGPP